MAMWTIETMQQFEKYLGLPPMIGRTNRKAFSGIEDRLWHKLQTWKEKTLFQGNKENLLKAIALTIPTYAMGCFKLPEAFCLELESLMAHFWWG